MHYAWSPTEERRNQLTDIVVKLTEELVQKELAELGELPNTALAQWEGLRVALSSFGDWWLHFNWRYGIPLSILALLGWLLWFAVRNL